MKDKLLKICQQIIEYSFYLLFFLIPLFLTPFNYELFEYNKMMLTYALTVIIVGSWLIKFILNFKVGDASSGSPKSGVPLRVILGLASGRTRKLISFRTPLDIPLLLFLASQIISTIFSIDRHVSIFGYYSRFNGGLLSTISYILLYYAFVTNFPKEKIKKLLTVILTSGVIVSVYGILEHFGIDKNIWVQDVQNRVFSTLGQPNWLAAYLAILIPITIGLSLPISPIRQIRENVQTKLVLARQARYIGFWILALLFYVTLLFTKSRSGFVGLWISLIVLWSIFLILYLINKLQSQKITHIHAIASICVKYIKLIGIYILSFILITFFIGAPFPQLNRFTIPELLINNQQSTINNLPASEAGQQSSKSYGGSIIDVGITESGVIRNIVWKGAIDIAKNYPLFGTGVETFAFAYYKFRPVEHNMTSEWDFLYNKAHNEYLNYAATTGFVGLGSYLLLIFVFVLWNINNLKTQISKLKTTTQNSKPNRFKILDVDLTFDILHLSFFTAWLSILVTNFFGFSVVVIQLFFYLIPAISFTLARPPLANVVIKPKTQSTLNNYQLIISALFLFFIFYLLYLISRLWYADLYFAAGHNASQSQEYTSAYQNFRQAIILNDNEPFYYNEFSLPSAQIAAALFDEKEGTISAQLTREAIMASDTAVTSSPNNVNFWKTRTRVYYSLSQIDEKYLTESLSALENARILSPTDPKIVYNLAVIYDKVGKREEAMKLLSETTKLKADYRDAYFAMGLFYERDKMKDKAKSQYEFILNRINPNDEETKKKLEEIK